MNRALAGTLCRILVVLMAWTPYQFAQAGMIGTDQLVTTSSQADRNTVLNFVARSDAASHLQSFGIDQPTAKDRVASMTDEEAAHLAGRIGSMPAGANSDWSSVIILIVIIAVVWWVLSKR